MFKRRDEKSIQFVYIMSELSFPVRFSSILPCHTPEAFHTDQLPLALTIKRFCTCTTFTTLRLHDYHDHYDHYTIYSYGYRQVTSSSMICVKHTDILYEITRH